MPWYRTGKVSLTNGSTNVAGTDTLWSTSVNPGDAFAIVDANGNPTGAWYEVATVTNNVGLTLVQSYAGSTVSNQNYVVFNLVGNMTTPSFAQRLAQFFDQFNDLIDQPTTTPTANMIPIADSGGKLNYGWLPDATTTTKGAVQLATLEEALAGADANKAVVPASLLVAAREFGFHPIAPKTAPVDLNTLLTPGVYTGPGAGADRVNWPHNGNYGTIIVTKRGSTVTQFVYLASPVSNIQVAVIRYFDGTSWTEFDLTKPHALAVTSTDDATSATAAPLKSAGGLAVAKNIIVGQNALISNTNILDKYFTLSAATSCSVLFSASAVVNLLGDVSMMCLWSSLINMKKWCLFGATTSAEHFKTQEIASLTQGELVDVSAPQWVSSQAFRIDITNNSSSAVAVHLLSMLKCSSALSVDVNIT